MLVVLLLSASAGAYLVVSPGVSATRYTGTTSNEYVLKTD